VPAPLQASVVAAIDDLELAARLIVHGLRTGHHRSPLKGFSAEFSQHRSYRPGDDLKYLDWKMLALSDRLYTRQFRETTNMSVMLAVDASGSMGFPATGTSKLRYAVVLAAAIAYLIVEHGDAVGLMAGQGDALRFLPARGSRAHLRALLAELARLEPQGTWAPDRVIARAAELLPRRGVLLVLSDFYDAEDDTRREMRRAAARGHDVGMLQILTREELTFPYSGDVEFEDLESQSRQRVAADTLARQYREAVAEFLERCRREARRDGFDYALFPTDVAPDQSLRKFLIQRGGGALAASGKTGDHQDRQGAR
jgi:uncharacterized protein (DUF58 family)